MDKKTHNQTNDAKEHKEDGGSKPEEIGGGKQKDPTYYGDWVINGRCIDF